MKRKFWFGVALFFSIGIVVMACSKNDVTGGTTTTTTDSTVNNNADSTVNPDAITVSDCSSATGIEKIICLADAFKAQLTSNQLATVQLSYSVSDAEKWSNLPQALSRNRVGLNFGSMRKIQIEYA